VSISVRAFQFKSVGWDGAVGIAARYELDGSGIECAGSHSAFHTMGTGSFPGVKRPGRGIDHPPHLAPRLKKE
jgi:hypothetical protein